MISPWPMATIEHDHEDKVQHNISNVRQARWATQRHTRTTSLP